MQSSSDGFFIAEEDMKLRGPGDVYKRQPKYDLRDWAPDHEKMGKGITLTEEEAKKLKELL